MRVKCEDDKVVAKTEMERRQSARLRIAIPMFLRGTDRQGKPFVDLATALNISNGGALLLSRRYMDPEAKISLEIPLAPTSAAASLPETVRHLKAQLVRVEGSERAYLMGVRFSDPLPA